MLTDLMSRLRPTASTAAAIAEAIDRCRVALQEADAAVTAAQGEWERSLLDADLKRLTALEEKLGEARTVAAAVKARVEAVMSQLEIRLALAKRREADEGVSAARKLAEDADKARRSWWETNRQKLAEVLREGERLDTLHTRAMSDFMRVIATVARSYPDADVSFPVPTGPTPLDWRDEVDTMMRPVHVAHVYQLTPEEQAEALDRQKWEQRYRDNPHPDGFHPKLLARA